MDDFIVAGKDYSSRLLVGTGKYKNFNETRAAIEASGAQIITIAIRRSFYICRYQPKAEKSNACQQR